MRGRRAPAVPERRAAATTPTTGRLASAPPSPERSHGDPRRRLAASSPTPARTAPTGPMLGAYALHPQILNDGRADFASQSVQRPGPDASTKWRRRCARSPTCRAASAGQPRARLRVRTTRSRYSNQGSVGMQRQFGPRCRSKPTTSTRACGRITSASTQHRLQPCDRRQLPVHALLRTSPYPSGARSRSRRSASPTTTGCRWRSPSASEPVAGVGDLLLLRQWDRQTRRSRRCHYVTTLGLQAAGVRRPRDAAPDDPRRVVSDPDQRHARRSTASGNRRQRFQVSGLFLFGDTAGPRRPRRRRAADRRRRRRVRANGT